VLAVHIAVCLLVEVQVDHRELVLGQQWLLHSSEELEIWLLYNKQDLVLLQELWVSVNLRYFAVKLDVTYIWLTYNSK
jgi:hypothetical protein